MPYLHNYRLFISHAWTYSERYERVIRMLNEANNFQWSNYSVPENDAFPRMTIAQLKEEIRGQIRPVQCVLIMSGMYVNHSDWIKFEMDVAYEMGKPILGIERRGAQRAPEIVRQYSNEMVSQTSASIVSAIRRLVP